MTETKPKPSRKPSNNVPNSSGKAVRKNTSVPQQGGDSSNAVRQKPSLQNTQRSQQLNQTNSKKTSTVQAKVGAKRVVQNSQGSQKPRAKQPVRAGTSVGARPQKAVVSNPASNAINSTAKVNKPQVDPSNPSSAASGKKTLAGGLADKLSMWKKKSPTSSSKVKDTDQDLLEENKGYKSQTFVALGILVFGILLSVYLVKLAPKAERQAVEQHAPLVQTIVASQSALRIPVLTRGSVRPRTEINILAEVEGTVLKLSENFQNGGFFAQDELLIQIDPARYKLEVTKKQSAVATSELFLSKTQANAKVARLGAKKNASSYALYVPQLKEAKAKLEAARADLQVAELKLSQTEIRAPFAGRVESKKISVGQHINVGELLAGIYSLDVAEVRLPISDKQLRLIDLPLNYSNLRPKKPLEESEGFDSAGLPALAKLEPDVIPTNAELPKLKISGRYGGKIYNWSGHIERTEGGLDQNQLLYVVGRIDAPYSWVPEFPKRPPLEPGLFIEAEIEGRHYDSIIVLPRQVIRGRDKVWVVDNESRLRIKEVSVLYRGPESAYIDSGIAKGDRIVETTLDYVVDGMPVRYKEVKPKIAANRS